MRMDSPAVSTVRSRFTPLVLGLLLAAPGPLAAQFEVPPRLTAWGSEGAAPGQFSDAIGIALDDDRNVYVSEIDNNRVQKFDRGGTFLTSWGSFGSDPGEFNLPGQLAVDGSGRVLVTDRGNHRVQIFDSEGTYLDSWGSLGSGEGEFNTPAGVCIDAAGNVYVCELLGGRIQKFDGDGNYLATIGSPGGGVGQLNFPVQLATDSAFNLYVTEPAQALVTIFDASGGFLREWPIVSSGPASSRGIFVDAFDRVFVTDTYNGMVRVFDAEGTERGAWKVTDAPPGILEQLGGVVLDARGRIYVTDRYSAQISMYGRERFSLASDFTTYGPGEIAMLRTFAGQATSPALLVLRDPGGSAMVMPVAAADLDATGAWTYEWEVPDDPALAGSVVTLRSFSEDENGEAVRSNLEFLAIP